jgi:hypothetical protein
MRRSVSVKYAVNVGEKVQRAPHLVFFRIKAAVREAHLLAIMASVTGY